MEWVCPGYLTFVLLLIQSIVLIVTFSGSDVTVHDVSSANWAAIMTPLWILLLLLFVYFVFVTWVVMMSGRRRNYSLTVLLVVIVLTLLGVGITLAILLAELMGNDDLDGDLPSTKVGMAAVPLLVFMIISLILTFTVSIQHRGCPQCLPERHYRRCCCCWFWFGGRLNESLDEQLLDGPLTRKTDGGATLRHLQNALNIHTAS